MINLISWCSIEALAAKFCAQNTFVMFRMNLIWKHDLLWVNLVDRIRNTFWANVSYFLYNEIYTLVCLKKLLLIMPCKRKMLLDKMIFMASFTKLPEWWVMKFWRVNAIWRDIFQVVYEMSDLSFFKWRINFEEKT